MCKQWFYLRVSTQTKGEDGEKQREQTFERQKGILERCGYVLTEENTFAERISGKTRGEERQKFEQMLSVLKEGDWVIFTETSRFSRTYKSGMDMLDILIFDYKVNIRFVSNNIELMAGQQFNPYVWYTISQMLLADELQRRVISYNTANGLQRKKEQGIQLGRPPKCDDDVVEKVKELQRQGYTCRQIADMLGMSKATVSRLGRK